MPTRAVSILRAAETETSQSRKGADSGLALLEHTLLRTAEAQARWRAMWLSHRFGDTLKSAEFEILAALVQTVAAKPIGELTFLMHRRDQTPLLRQLRRLEQLGLIERALQKPQREPVWQASAGGRAAVADYESARRQLLAGMLSSLQLDGPRMVAAADSLARLASLYDHAQRAVWLRGETESPDHQG